MQRRLLGGPLYRWLCPRYRQAHHQKRAKTQAEVKEKLVSALEDTKDLDVSRSDDYTVSSWLTNWYTLYAKPNVRVSTAEYYRRSIELHVNPRIGGIKLNKLTAHRL